MEHRLEHVNITVKSIDEGVRFLTAVFPDFNVRGDGQSDHGDHSKHWLHVGTDRTYLALEEVMPRTESPRKPYHDPGTTTPDLN